MPEYWLSVWPVDHGRRVFLTGRIPGQEDYEQELTPAQVEMYMTFMQVQSDQEEKFLMGLVT